MAGFLLLFVGGLTFALAGELFEQMLSGPVPALVDVAPPAGFVTCGAGLVLLGRSARQATPR